MAHILLVQPRHTYAPVADGVDGHVYMPTSLLAVASRLITAGVSVDLCDENVAESTTTTEFCGVNMIGAPYVERVREIAERTRRSHGNLILGGRVVSGFLPVQLARLFGDGVVNGNDDHALSSALGIPVNELPATRRTSLIEAYEQVPDRTMAKYLDAEFAFFLSQGCRYTCTFCAAERSGLDHQTGRIRTVSETYRDTDVVEADLNYLVERAQSLLRTGLRIYLSNLDLFQTPMKLREFVSVVERIRKRHSDFRIEMRGLSTVGSFLGLHRKEPALIERLVACGLTRVGFGVDGATPAVWKATRKPHSSETSCIDAIAIARTAYRITPETLMVFGHYGVDTPESLVSSVEFTRAMWNEYGSLPRPHVAKNVIPGNDGWYEASHDHIIEALISWPIGFQALDFTALPSELTHPDRDFCVAATRSYLDACAIDGAVTRHVLPVHSGMGREELATVAEFNRGRYDI